jgi:para-nitrobenzyl esterase
VAKEIGAALGREATAESLAEVSLPELVSAQAAVRDALAAQPDPSRFGATIVASSMAFIPVADGSLIPEHPLSAITSGAGSGIPLLTGTNTDEFGLFLAPTGLSALVTEESLPSITGLLGIGALVAGVYRALRPDDSPGDLLAAMLTDRFFRLPALAVAQARPSVPAAASSEPARTYMYEFAWPSPVTGLGACHSLEIPFVFDNLSAEGAEQALGTAPPAGLARRMHAAWVSFARDGDPGWRAFDDTYPVMIFDAAGCGVHQDPRGEERRAWGHSS